VQHRIETFLLSAERYDCCSCCQPERYNPLFVPGAAADVGSDNRNIYETPRCRIDALPAARLKSRSISPLSFSNIRMSG
jgi:hypothetical protein